MKIKYIIPVLVLALLACKNQEEPTISEPENEEVSMPFVWENANVYFLLTDRFNNGNPDNDINFERTRETAVLRGFEGGDLQGVTQKIESGYFNDLGVNAIWMTPIVEQIHGATDEGTGVTYGYHGYWTKDWTAIDPNFGTAEDLSALVSAAHSKGIRILLDAVINHTGPVTEIDPVWPEEWVRTEPKCEFQSYESTITCTLVKNLPDIKTESNETVDLPPQLVEKWKAEGRYDEEVAELDAFFERTGHPRAPRFYIMKWLTDYITDYGIDGYRVDTVKHTEEFVWQEFKKECDYSFAKYKEANPDKVLDDNPFYLVGEVYNYHITSANLFDMGDVKVDFYKDAFKSLINFDLKANADKQDYESLFSSYSKILSNELKDYSVLNYITSHDDGSPYDKERAKPMKGANWLFFTPGASQIYYGDELARSLIIEGTQGDATLRSSMDWSQVESNADVLAHWQKLGRFKSDHPAVGAGTHAKISDAPYTFSRKFVLGDAEDKVVVGLDLPEGEKTLEVASVFSDGDVIRDAYSGEEVTVKDGSVTLNTKFNTVLLETTNKK